MLEWLIEIDTELFIFFNYTLANPVFDVIMPLITNDWCVRAVFVVIVLYLVLFDGKRGRILAIAAVVAVTISDQLAATFVKEWVGRVRPCHVVEPVNLLVNCSQGLSFPSAHATNTFGVATLLGLIYARARWYLVGYAVIVSYSRIAVGVHYPFDTVCGALLGISVGIAVYQFYQIAEIRWLKPQVQDTQADESQ